MRINPSCGALVAFLALSASPGMAATADGAFSIRGIGAQSCAQVVEGVDGDEAGTTRLFLASWTAGYLTRANRDHGSAFETMPVNDTAVVTEVAINLCRDNPDVLFEATVAALVANLSSAAQDRASDLLEVSYGEAALSVRREVIRLVQQQLVALGLLPAGTDDGLFGPRTAEALLIFQETHGLPETGLPDVATLVAIFAPQ